jgi:glucose-6-phosphate 1-epimerase
MATAPTTSGPSKGKGDLDTVVIRHVSGASAEVYLFGATLCSYKTPDGAERIFVSPGAVFDGKKAIRGGVPLVFPQFGQPDKAMAQHGVARTALWTLKGVSDGVDASEATFSLSDNDETRKVWDHAFELEFKVVLSAVSLKMCLQVKNIGAAPFNFHALLHTYFRIPDIGECAVRGLAGRTYSDKVDNTTKTEDAPHIELPSYTDRVYLGAEPGAKDVLVGSKVGSVWTPLMSVAVNEASVAGQVVPCDVVVWNPYEEKSPGDLPPPAFKEFVCVEPGMVGKLYELAPGSSAELSQKIIPL